MLITVSIGCNVENGSYGATICAERTAYVKAVSEGEHEFTDLAVATYDKGFSAPCGICRQFMSEFGLTQKVHLANEQGDFKTESVDSLLPGAFKFEPKRE
ncbi:cytidine deaminase-like protein [Syncephalis plumigaleata]|nr:cytidine deaminase-like protein [Syncephalis plumigaleata]